MIYLHLMNEEKSPESKKQKDIRDSEKRQSFTTM